MRVLGESRDRGMRDPRRVSRALLVYSAIALLVFWPLAAVVLFRGNALGFAIALCCSGLQGLCLAGYAFARANRKQWWRWLVLATGGLGILMFSLVDAVDLDLHGFFELLITGNSRRGYRSHDGDHHRRAAHLWPNSVWMGVLACDGARASSRQQGLGPAQGCLGLDTACRCGRQFCGRSSVRAGV